MISKRNTKTLDIERKYRNRVEVKEYQKRYRTLYQQLKNNEISLDEFEALKPKMSEIKRILKTN